MDYYYSDSKFVMFNYGLATNYPIPAPVGYDTFYEAGDYDYTSVSHLFTITDNFRLNRRFSIGYGLGATNRLLRRFDYFYNDYDQVTSASTDDRCWNLGLSFVLHWYTGEYFHFQVLYQPTFVRLGPRAGWVYEHTLSVNFRWNVRNRSVGKRTRSAVSTE